uniref:Uncharacterized protein n=1 Tax=Macrostomum lignano TaxID=282301 RepID=A0A1I8FCB4_9PLAT
SSFIFALGLPFFRTNWKPRPREQQTNPKDEDSVMGNRESSSQMSCGSASDADFLDSSTDSSYVSYEACTESSSCRDTRRSRRQHRRPATVQADNTPVPLAAQAATVARRWRQQSRAAHSVDLTPRTSLQLPDSPASSDLCSILNHHHDDERRHSAMARCACRRSLSTGTGDQQQQQQQQSLADLNAAPLEFFPMRSQRAHSCQRTSTVLPPRRKHQQLDEQRLSSSSARPDHSCCEPMSFCGPGCTPLELVHRVTARGVRRQTDEESYLALTLHHWTTERAARYLKVEQLFRWGVSSSSEQQQKQQNTRSQLKHQFPYVVSTAASPAAAASAAASRSVGCLDLQHRRILGLENSEQVTRSRRVCKRCK